jgi:putative phosphoesterase
MLIGLISDTHIPWAHVKLPDQVKKAFQGVELILHAGDIWISPVLDELEQIAPVLAARGDDDLDQDVGKDKRVVDRQVLRYEGLDVWVMHQKPRRSVLDGPEANLPPSILNGTPPTHELNHRPNVVVFGHNHYPEIEDYNGILLVSPGSPNYPMYVPKLGTVGLLTLQDGKAEARIIQLEKL